MELNVYYDPKTIKPILSNILEEIKETDGEKEVKKTLKKLSKKYGVNFQFKEITEKFISIEIN